MSEPIRYAFKMYDEDDAIYLGAKEQADGMWVKWEDYACLKEQVERLTKAGDAFENEFDYLTQSMRMLDNEKALLKKLFSRWLAAKEGKQ